MKKRIIIIICFLAMSCLKEPKKNLIELSEEKDIISSELNNVTDNDEFEYIGKTFNGLRLVTINRKYGFINELDKLVIDLEYDAAWDYDNGLARVYKRYSSTGEYPYIFKWGFININGEEEIPLIYNRAMPFENGLSEVRKDGITFYINEKGERSKIKYKD